MAYSASSTSGRTEAVTPLAGLNSVAWARVFGLELASAKDCWSARGPTWTRASYPAAEWFPARQAATADADSPALVSRPCCSRGRWRDEHHTATNSSTSTIARTHIRPSATSSACFGDASCVADDHMAAKAKSDTP
jgi:hypothetical protein